MPPRGRSESRGHSPSAPARSPKRHRAVAGADRNRPPPAPAIGAREYRFRHRCAPVRRVAPSAARNTPSRVTRRSSMSISVLSSDTSLKRSPRSNREVPSTYSVSCEASSSSVKTGASASRKADSVLESEGSCSRWWSMRAPRPSPHQTLVEVTRGPIRQPRIDRPGEREQPLAHSAGRGDHDHHQHLRLEREHFDVADRRGLDRRGGDDRQQVVHLGEGLRGHAHGLVQLAANQRQRQARSESCAGSSRSTK